MTDQADLSLPELPETPDQWAERLLSRAAAGETIVIREGERGLDAVQMAWLRGDLERAGGRVFVVKSRGST